MRESKQSGAYILVHFCSQSGRSQSQSKRPFKGNRRVTAGIGKESGSLEAVVCTEGEHFVIYRKSRMHTCPSQSSAGFLAAAILGFRRAKLGGQ